MSAPGPRFPPRRPLGRTGFAATRLGAGDLADRQVPIERCVETLVRALDAGLNVVDTAPAYEDGYSEEIVGRALRGRRDPVFLIDKIDHLREPVGPQVAASLGRLGLDRADLFVFHSCSTPDDWAAIAAPGGGLDQLGAEIAAGRARFAGVSSHHPEVLRAALDSGRCSAFAAADAFEPLSDEELAGVRRRAEDAIRGKGRCWWNPAPSPR
jgi:aryl-alcohol dehydrogenase-like predicted oxidoreductase